MPPFAELHNENVTVETVAKAQKTDAISTLQVKLLSAAATLPRRGSARAAGYDLARWASSCRTSCNILCIRNVVLDCSAADCTVPARGKAVVPTDLAIAIPPNTYARVAPRSGLAVKHFIDTAAGVIDEDYRGPVGVVLFNHGPDDFQGVALVSMCRR